MYIRSASSPSTALWEFNTIQPSSFSFIVRQHISIWHTTTNAGP